MRNWSLRDWVYIAIIGALWGVIEISLGSYLHILIPSLANTFFSGLVLGFLGIAIVLMGQHLLPHHGAILMIGIVTALLKLLSYGGVKLGPIIAILAQAALMELGLWMGRSKPFHYVLAGALALGWNALHPFLMLPLIYGRSISQVYGKLVQDGTEVLGLSANQGMMILLLLLLIRWVIGGVAGWLAWRLGRSLQNRARTTA